MKFLSRIKFTDDVVFESNREDHKKNFKIKKRTYMYTNHRKSTYDTTTHKRILVKEKVTERTFVIFPKDLTIEFKSGINVIVGDNGCGKSSLLKKIFFPKFEKPWFSDKTDAEQKQEHINNYVKGKTRELLFDKFPNLFINGKEIHKNVFIENLKNSKITLSGHDVLAMWDMHDFSNGENTLDFLRSLEAIENGLIMLDEPETSLSIKSQRLIAKLLTKIAEKNQVIIITHAPVLMETAKEVYDFEKKQWINTEEYIKQLYK